jgi:hypothetical protein
MPHALPDLSPAKTARRRIVSFLQQARQAWPRCTPLSSLSLFRDMTAAM